MLHRYRNDPAFVPELDFVMELDGELIGHVKLLGVFMLTNQLLI